MRSKHAAIYLRCREWTVDDVVTGVAYQLLENKHADHGRQTAIPYASLIDVS